MSETNSGLQSNEMSYIIGKLISNKNALKLLDLNKKNKIYKKARIIDYNSNKNEIKIHWIRFSNKWDEIIKLNDLKNRMTVNEYHKHFVPKSFIKMFRQSSTDSITVSHTKSLDTMTEDEVINEMLTIPSDNENEFDIDIKVLNEMNDYLL
mmetsp:Transcript_84757/g.103925  ORF Transcript_84757/g.103925 Transcript_84757/m.103925 type:complete len:151 (+) Transcript_84757:89-541(+)